MVGPFFDPQWVRNQAAAHAIEQQTEQARRRRDSNFARLQDEIQGLHRQHGLFGLPEPKNVVLRLLWRTFLTVVLLALGIGIPFALLMLASFLFSG